MVYTWAMCDIYEIVLTFLGVYDDDDIFLHLVSIIPLKQLSGFKWWRASLYMLLSYISVFLTLACIMLVAAEIQIYLEAM